MIENFTTKISLSRIRNDSFRSVHAEGLQKGVESEFKIGMKINVKLFTLAQPFILKLSSPVKSETSRRKPFFCSLFVFHLNIELEKI